MRLAILKRDKYRCHYCKEQVTLDDANIDHKKPWKLGGKTTPQNLVAACPPCNYQKGNQLLDQNGKIPQKALAKNPVREINYSKLVRPCGHPTTPFCMIKACLEQSEAIPRSKTQKVYRTAARWIQAKKNVSKKEERAKSRAYRTRKPLLPSA